MMKLKLSLRNSVKQGLLLSLVLLAISFSGCSSSTTPTYSKDDIEESIVKIVAAEYKMDIKAKLTGQTLWIYLPVDKLFDKTDKPEKYKERFEIGENENKFDEGKFSVTYFIKPLPVEKEKQQEVALNKETVKKLNDVWSVLRRIIFSMSAKDREAVQFYQFVIADIKSGYEMRELTYYKDIIKVVYRYISSQEYHHRVVFDVAVSYRIIDDKEGKHLKYKNYTMAEFLAAQIKHRINKKFQGAEVAKNVNIDKEVEKVIRETLKIYGYNDFQSVALTNLFTNSTLDFTREEIFSPGKR